MRHGRRDGRHCICSRFLASHGTRFATLRIHQIPNLGDNIEQAGQEAGKIYSRYGGLTTAASIIATWAIIHTAHRH